MKNGLENFDTGPLHTQIKNDLLSKLEGGFWKEGDLFPTDKQLMEQYNVSSTTVRRAISELVNDGWLIRRSGKGTFVRKNVIENLNKLTGFFEEMKAKGMKASAKVLRAEIVTINDDLLHEIPLLEEFNCSKIFQITKIQKANNKPIVYNKNFWPIQIGLELIKYDLTQMGIYDIVQNELGVTLEEAHETIYAGEAGVEEAAALNIKENSPVLIMERTTYCRGKAFEVAVNSYRADSYRYKVSLKRDNLQSGQEIII